MRALALYSRLGDHGLVWLAIALAGRRLSGHPRWTHLLRSVLAAYGVNQLIKVIVRRPRPRDKVIQVATELSYPSAHAATSLAAARVVPQLYPAAVLMAGSRIALRVHHPSDVVAGAVLGTAVAELAAP